MVHLRYTAANQKIGNVAHLILAMRFLLTLVHTLIWLSKGLVMCIYFTGNAAKRRGSILGWWDVLVMKGKGEDLGLRFREEVQQESQ